MLLKVPFKFDGYLYHIVQSDATVDVAESSYYRNNLIIKENMILICIIKLQCCGDGVK